MCESENMLENSFAKVKVVGVGGSGISALNYMVKNYLEGVDFLAVDTDDEALLKSMAPEHIKIIENAVQEARSKIVDAFRGYDMVLIVGDMSGGTGTEIAALVAECSRENDILTVGIVTYPLTFEEPKNKRDAELGVENLKKHVDTIIAIPNDRLVQTVDKNASKENTIRS